MKLEELLYKTPEMTEEKLLELIDKSKQFLKKDLYKTLFSKTPNKNESEVSKTILDEWDLIQEKQSNLTKSQRDQVLALVSYCLIQMTKGEDEKYDEYEEVSDGGSNTGEESSDNSVEDIPETV